MEKTTTAIFGVILTLLGVLGFVSNPLIGANALFVADAMHNVIHIVLGVTLLVAAFRAGRYNSFWLKGTGFVLFLLGLVGILLVPSAGGLLFGIAMTNGSTDWFHLVAGIVIFIGSVYGKDDSPAAPQASGFA